MSSLWIFGYGSLVWRPAFAHSERRPAFIEGWARRFWQGSTDHRGEPGAPGRVVTLVPEPSEICWGMAYRVDAEAAPAVLETLDHRERGGYARCNVRVEFGDGRQTTGLIYIATPSNANYLGPASLEGQRRCCSLDGKLSAPSGTTDAPFWLDLGRGVLGL